VRAVHEQHRILESGMSDLTVETAMAHARHLAEERRLRSRLEALEGQDAATVQRALTERVDDLVGQVDKLRGGLEHQRRELFHAGLIQTEAEADGSGPASDLPPGAPAEPWSHEYNAAHRALVAAELDDPALLGALRSEADLTAPLGPGFDERVVEIPWAAAHLDGRSVLDAGSSLNHLHVLRWLRPRVADLHIITLAPEARSFPQLHVSYLYADLRDLPIRDNRYDTVVSISTLEHVGMNNAGYGSPQAPAANAGREAAGAVRELRRVLRPGGSLLITVPVGEPAAYGWVRVLAIEELKALVADAPWSASTMRFFRHGPEGWAPATEEGVRGARYRDHFTAGPPGDDRVVAAEAVACLRLTK